MIDGKSYGVPCIGQDDRARDAYLAERERALQGMTTETAVAPGAVVFSTHRGKLGAGTAVDVLDFGGRAYELHAAIQDGAVLAVEPEVLRKNLALQANPKARYIVGASAVLCAGVTRVPGEPLEAADAGGADNLKHLVTRGLVVDREAPVPPEAA